MRLIDLLTKYSESLSKGVTLPLDGLSEEDRVTAQLINDFAVSCTHKIDTLEKNRVALASILDTVPQGIFWKDSESMFLGCNQIFADMIGLRSPQDIIGKTDYELVSLQKAKKFRQDDVEVLKTNEIRRNLNYPSPTASHWTDTTKVPLSTPDGIFGVLGVSEDITERILSEKKLQLSEKKFRLLAETVKDIIWMMDPNLKLTYISPSITTIAGFTPEEAMTLPVWKRFPKETLRFVRGLNNEINRKTMDTYAFDYEMFRKDRSRLWVSVKFTVLRDEAGEMTAIIGSTSDISGRKRKENELTLLANTDALTGVHNRRAFIDKLTNEILTSRETAEPLSLVMLDIDHFKKVNDTYGHPAGDEAIKTLTVICVNHSRPADTVGRLGGEEFAVLMPGTPLKNALGMAERLRGLIEREPIPGLPAFYRITSSLGVTCLGPQDTAETIMQRVDKALYQAKNSGRNRVVSLQA